MTWDIQFQDGTLVVYGATLADLPSAFKWDHRIGAPRGPGYLYPKVVLDALKQAQEFTDSARQWSALTDLTHIAMRTPRPYQQEALDAWLSAGRCGTVILPTGAGKTFVAELAILKTQRPALVVTPTLDLVGQWHDRLKASFQEPIGILGGGYHEIQRLTVTTYDSAYLYMGKYGDRFGLIVFDEVHHLPAQGYLNATKMAMAPFRLGLTATYMRGDGRENLLEGVLGEVVYERNITELSGVYLSDYEVIKILVALTDSEREEYVACRQRYTDFLKAKNIRMGGNGWQRFIRAAAQSKVGRTAFQSYLRAKAIAHSAVGKFVTLEQLLARERGRRIIIFTHDNASAYHISTHFLVPCITHHTDLKERRKLLDDFDRGHLTTLVTSRVLNEGVDIQRAEVAVVMSGSGTVREHVQRLGRILRPAQGKHAILYELVAQDTAEENTSRRRREHDAYR
ncbi:MAG: DEAD/DEAH box helicase family protein [Myxococcota bacterium]|nr:DEAD/DEAH box helicase family protein [Myxococcota bacterium]